MSKAPQGTSEWPASINPQDIETAHTNLPVDVNPPTTEEIRMAIKQIKSGIAAGPDIIPAEALKSDIESVTEPDERCSRRPTSRSTSWIP
ncbi:unnamed protein product [Schistosoma curassoni]|uniref:VbhA domain-containing protein n=1 Tax=Schistosoma curassoni TaxID=6186 RepID=A0A183KAD6_9TREM|nr:unnamed protein product [Schistosoma curassoni]